MAFNEELAFRIRQQLANEPHFEEKRMFGGVVFMYKGKMSIGVNKDLLMVRVLSEKMEQVLTRLEVTPMTFTGKPMKEFVTVSLAGCETEPQLAYYITLGIEHAESKQ